MERMHDDHRALGIFPHPAVMERLDGAWQITRKHRRKL